MNKYKLSIILLCVAVVTFTFLFKWKTGSFIKISESSKKEVVKYEFEKRRHDLTTSSLSKSSQNIDKLVGDLIVQLSVHESKCVDDFYLLIKNMPSDSAMLHIMYKIYDYAVFNEKVKTSKGFKNIVTGYNQSKCNEHLYISFEPNDENEMLIVEIGNFVEFINCHCVDKIDD
jgi:hypothetical protein